MALRLFLVGVVASLALDLPDGGTSPPRRSARAARAWIESEIVRNVPDAGSPLATVVASEPVATVDTAAAIAPAPPIQAVVAGVTKPAPPTIDAAPTPAAAPVPMPTPAEIAAAPSPAAEAAPAPVPATTVAATEPIAPPEPAVLVEPVAPPAPVVVVETAKPADPDAAFEAIVSRMAATFAADVPAPAAEPRPSLANAEPTIPTSPEFAPPPPAADEVAEADEFAPDLFPGLAFALNRQAEGLGPMPPPAPERPEPAPVVAADPVEAPAAAPEPAPEPDPSRADRLAHAVRLTGQAMNAWAGLLKDGPNGAASLQR